MGTASLDRGEPAGGLQHEICCGFKARKNSSQNIVMAGIKSTESRIDAVFQDSRHGHIQDIIPAVLIS